MLVLYVSLAYWEFKIKPSDYQDFTVDEILGDISADSNTKNQLPTRSEFYICQRKQHMQNDTANLLFMGFFEVHNSCKNNYTTFLLNSVYTRTGNKLQKSIMFMKNLTVKSVEIQMPLTCS
jgi:hypothetical protein